MNYITTGIEYMSILKTGSVDDMKNITNPNQVGSIVDVNNNFVSYTTPMAIVIENNPKNYQDKIDVLIKNGGNINKIINYNGVMMSIKDIMIKYR